MNRVKTVLIVLVVTLLSVCLLAGCSSESPSSSKASSSSSSSSSSSNSSSSNNSSSKAPQSSSSGGNTGSAVDSAKETVKSKIKTIVSDNYKDTKVSSITVNDDAGSGSGYIVIANLTWDVKNSGATSKKMLSMYSEDLAARVGEDCSNVNEIAVCWDVPYLKASAKVSYKRSGSGMVLQDQTWGKEFN